MNLKEALVRIALAALFAVASIIASLHFGFNSWLTAIPACSCVWLLSSVYFTDYVQHP
jgi:hypothetical protein